MDNVTPLQFWLGILTITLPQIFILIGKWKDAKTQAPLSAAQAESAMGDALEKLGQAYDRALTTIKSQDEELKGLRPLVIDIALAKQQATQTQQDKDDWKNHASKLESQLKENKIVPVTFKRQSLNGDSEKMKAVTRAQVEKYIGGREQPIEPEKESLE
jgi:hypothetical protein